MFGGTRDRHGVSARGIWRVVRGYLAVFMSLVVFFAFLAIVTVVIRFLQVL